MDIPGVIVEPSEVWGLFMLCLALKCLGLEYLFVSGRGSSLV